MSFTVKDSGVRSEYESGMKRDTNEGKIRFDLVVPENMENPMLKRWADHMTKGAVKYGDRNWEKAAGVEELKRFRESAFRHFMQWYLGEVDEDHAAAVYFNIQGAEYVKEKRQPHDIHAHIPADEPYVCVHCLDVVMPIRGMSHETRTLR